MRVYCLRSPLAGRCSFLLAYIPHMDDTQWSGFVTPVVYQNLAFPSSMSLREEWSSHIHTCPPVMFSDIWLGLSPASVSLPEKPRLLGAVASGSPRGTDWRGELVHAHSPYLYRDPTPLCSRACSSAFLQKQAPSWETSRFPRMLRPKRNTQPKSARVPTKTVRAVQAHDSAQR